MNKFTMMINSILRLEIWSDPIYIYMLLQQFVFRVQPETLANHLTSSTIHLTELNLYMYICIGVCV